MKFILFFIGVFFSTVFAHSQDTITYTAKWSRTNYEKVIAFYGIKDYDENGVGMATYYHKDGTLHSHQMEKKDLKHGHCVWYHKNGNKLAEGDYINDKPEGAYRFYHQDGEFYREDWYKDGKITDKQSPPPPIEYEEIEIVDTEDPDEGFVIEFPDVEAQFPGGNEAMFAFIQDNMEYPMVAIMNDDQGKVYIKFVVERDGSLSQIAVERGVTQELDSVALACVTNMPKWTPGEIKGKKCRTRCRLPIVFTLAGDDDAPVEFEKDKRRRRRRK